MKRAEYIDLSKITTNGETLTIHGRASDFVVTIAALEAILKEAKSK